MEGTIPANVKATPICELRHDGAPATGSACRRAASIAGSIPDLRTAASLFGLYDRSLYPLGIEPSLGNNLSVTEDDTGIWGQLDFRFEMFGLPFRGNAGVRYVQTDQSSTGYSYVGNQAVKTTVDNDYGDWLPSFNLVADVTDTFLVRLSASQVMTRPPLGNLAPSTSISVSGNSRTVTTGNPYLEPFKADAYDLSFEWYFAEQSLLSLALFYKDIKTYVTTTRDTRPFAGNPYGLPDELGVAACGTIAGCTIFADWIFSVPHEHAGRRPEGLRVELPAAVHVPAGHLEQLRRHPELHGYRFRGGLPQCRWHGRHPDRPDRPFEEFLQRNAVLRGREADRARRRFRPGRVPDDGAGQQRQQRRRARRRRSTSTSRSPTR